MKRLSYFCAAAVSALLFAAAPARAGLVAWTYNWTPGSLAIQADPGGTGGVSFTNEPTKNAQGNSDIVATNIAVFSSASASNPDKMMVGGTYTLNLVLTDSASGQHATLSWTGKLTGTFSSVNSLLANAFTSPQTLSVALGGNTYTVTIGPYTPAGPPTASNKGSIAAHVNVTPGVVQHVPEPSTLLLSFLGVTLAGGAAWRKRRLALA
jgi:hypothetical protein